MRGKTRGAFLINTLYFLCIGIVLAVLLPFFYTVNSIGFYFLLSVAFNLGKLRCPRRHAATWICLPVAIRAVFYFAPAFGPFMFVQFGFLFVGVCYDMVCQFLGLGCEKAARIPLWKLILAICISFPVGQIVPAMMVRPFFPNQAGLIVPLNVNFFIHVASMGGVLINRHASGIRRLSRRYPKSDRRNPN